MVTLYLKDFVQYNTFKDIYAVTWQLAYDKDFKFIFLNDYRDAENIYSLTVRVPFDVVRDPNKKVYARVKLYYLADNGRLVESDWFVLKEDRSRIKRLPLKKNGVVVGYIDRDNNRYEVTDLVSKK